MLLNAALEFVLLVIFSQERWNFRVYQEQSETVLSQSKKKKIHLIYKEKWFKIEMEKKLSMEMCNRVC